MSRYMDESGQPIPTLSDAKVVDAWHKNATPWSGVVRHNGIESRVLVTDSAVVEAVTARRPKRVIDIGCGEGWLANRLAGQGVDVLGVDAVPALIERARGDTTARFEVLSYEALAQGALAERFNVAVCNFSLLGEAAVANLVRTAPSLLERDGALIIQTLHPVIACGEADYRDGWREGSWAGIEGAFSEPAPWYFRTLESWVALIEQSGFSLKALKEPLHPKTGKPASVIFVAESTMEN